MSLSEARPAPHTEYLAKPLPRALTTYDFLKAFALITMIIDHIGFYFYPDALWLRVIGRTSMPVWMFLIGYANSREISAKMLGGGAILVLGNILAGMPIFALNILFTIAFIRKCLDPVMRWLLKDRQFLFEGTAMLWLAGFGTMIVFEYGTQALIMAVFGYLVRRREVIGSERILWLYLGLTILTFMSQQFIMFWFSPVQMAVLGALLVAVYAGLMRFKPAELPRVTASLPGPLNALIRLCGRKTLELYVIHLLLFKALAVYWGMEGYAFLQWSWL